MSRSALQREAQRSKQHFLGRGAGSAAPPTAPISGVPASGYHLMNNPTVPFTTPSYATSSSLSGVYYPPAPSASGAASSAAASAASYGYYTHHHGASAATAAQYYYGYNYSQTTGGTGFDAQAYYNHDASALQQQYPYYSYAIAPTVPEPAALHANAAGSASPPPVATEGEGAPASTADILSSYGLSYQAGPSEPPPVSVTTDGLGHGSGGGSLEPQPSDTVTHTVTSANSSSSVSHNYADLSSGVSGIVPPPAPSLPSAPSYDICSYGGVAAPPPPPPPPPLPPSFTATAGMMLGDGYAALAIPAIPATLAPLPDAASTSSSSSSSASSSVAASTSAEAPQRSSLFPVYGNSHTFNLNPLLHTNILQCDYFRALFQLKTYHEVVDEIYSTVRHLAPWQTGTTRAPSSAFCLLLKLLVMGITHNQVHGLLATDDCPYVRGIGLLILRYICAPKDLYGYFEPYLEDDTMFSPSHDEAEQMTMGAYAIKLLTDMQYFGTTLPRIPVPIERKIKVLLLLLKEKQTRRLELYLKYYDGPHLDKGASVQAIYSDEENEPAWYAGVIQRKASLDEVNDLNKRLVNIDSSNSYPMHYYWVHFPEYGNTELVDLGDIKISGGDKDSHGTSSSRSSRSRSASRGEGDGRRHRRDDRSSSRGRDHRDRSRRRSRSRSRTRSRSRSRDRGGRGVSSATATRDLMAEVLKNEREASEAVGRNYAHRPASYKGSLSLKQERYTVRKKSRSRSPLPRSSQSSRSAGAPASSSMAGVSGHAAQQASMAASREYQEKMKKLIDRYGDASAK